MTAGYSSSSVPQRRGPSRGVIAARTPRSGGLRFRHRLRPRQRQMDLRKGRTITEPELRVRRRHPRQNLGQPALRVAKSLEQADLDYPRQAEVADEGKGSPSPRASAPAPEVYPESHHPPPSRSTRQPGAVPLGWGSLLRPPGAGLASIGLGMVSRAFRSAGGSGELCRAELELYPGVRRDGLVGDVIRGGPNPPVVITTSATV